MIDILLTAFETVDKPESIVAIIVSSLVPIIGSILAIIKKKTKKPESVEKNLDKVNGILKTFSDALTKVGSYMLKAEKECAKKQKEEEDGKKA